MRKVLLSLVMLLGLFTGCSEDEIIIDERCNCGYILSDRASDYSVVITSDCSGSNKRWTLSRDNWMIAHVGTKFCISNSTGW